jgi:DNA replication protein DnaC
MQYVENKWFNVFESIDRGLSNTIKPKRVDAFVWECKKCEDTRIRETKEEEDKKKFQKIHSEIPKIYHNCKISDFQNIDRVLEWAKKPSGFLFIHGKTGTGKTHLVCSIKKRYNEIGINSSLFFSSEIFLEIRNSFNPKNNTSEEEIIDKCTEGIAFFDDFGTQKNTEFSIETWYNIINKRYMEDIPTIITSNITLKEISILMSDRIASRIASGEVFELNGIDRRLSNKPSKREPKRDLTEIF